MHRARPSTFTLNRFFLIFTLILASGFLLAACQSEGQEPGPGDKKTGQQVPGPASVPEAVDTALSPFAGQVLFYLDDYPVKEDELRLFARDQLGTQHGAGFHKGSAYNAPLEEILQVVPAYVRYYALVQEARRRGIDKEEWFTSEVRLKRQTVLAPHMMEHITDNASLKPDEVLAMLPPDWVKMNFKIRVFPDIEVAGEAYKRVESGESFEDVELPGYTLTARPDGPLPETGLIWPESGFFDPIDDAYLFSLQVGDVSQPVRTGLGGALVKVVDKHEYTQAEQSEFLKKKRDELVKLYARSATGRIKRAADISIDMKVLAEGFYREIDEGLYSQDTVATIGSVELSYRQFRKLELIAVSWIRKGMPREKWPHTVKGYLNSLMDKIALGMEAERLGIELPPGSKNLLHQFSWDLLYRASQATIFKEASVDVTYEEVAQYYEENSAKYGPPQSVEIQYYYSEDNSLIETLARKHKEGTPFDSLTMNGEGSGVSGEFSEIGPKTTSLPRSADKRPYAEPLYDLPKGQVTMLKGPNGLYYVKVLETFPAVPKPLEEVRERITRDIENKKKRSQAEKVIEGMTKVIRFRWADENMAPKELPGGEPSPELMERG